jgi:hypothetical protein
MAIAHTEEKLAKRFSPWHCQELTREVVSMSKILTSPS